MTILDESAPGRKVITSPLGQASSPEEDNGSQEDGKTEDVGPAILAVCKTPPVLQQGKEILNFVTLAIHSLAVMDWFLAAATGRDARDDALLGQHLTDFVAVIPLIPHHRGRRRQSLSSTSAAVKSLHCPLTQVEPQGATFAVADPIELAGHAPLGATNQARGAPLVEAGCPAMGFDV